VRRAGHYQPPQQSQEDHFASDVPNVTVSPQRVPISASMAIGNRSSRMRGHRTAQAGTAVNEGVAVSTSPARRLSFRDVFAVPEFRALWISYVLSALGDRLALVALTLLVYDRTRSPLLAAITFAAGFVPYFFGGMLLSGLADRLPRRSVMVGCDLARVVLVAAMLAPGVPLAAMIALLYAVTLLQPPFDASRSASVRDMMEAGRYPLAIAVIQTTNRSVVVVGTAVAGFVVALAGARLALGLDAATFVASALLVGLGTRARPAAMGEAGPNPVEQIAAGVRLVFGNPALRTLLCLGWLAAFYEVPEGLAAPYAGSLGGGAVAAGLLLAVSQLGAAVSTPLFTKRLGPLTRLKWMGPMAVLACGILTVTVFRPNLIVSMALFALSNSFAMYQLAANTAFVELIPNEKRGQAFGLANAGLAVGQGVAFALAGAAAEVVPPSTVVALSGGIGALIACGLTFRWRGMSPAVGRHTARHLGREASLTRQTPIRSGSL
jgi:predicted MFS family arabinose efflux permease